MYSERYRFIYIRIPKTASTTIVRTLSKLTDGEIHPKQTFPTHPALHHYATTLVAPLDQYFIFTFVRNPWARMVSGYFFSRAVRKRRAHQIDFRGFCHFQLQRYQYNNCLWHTQPIPYSFVGRMETLQADFDRLCDRLGLARAALPHYNASCHGDYRQYYDDETRALVARKYARDIDLFNYTF